MKYLKNLVKTLTAALAVVSASAMAQIDTTAVAAGLADMGTAITTVGGLIIGVAVIAVAFKWIKGALFG